MQNFLLFFKMATESESYTPDPAESVSKDEFENWLINKVSRQSSMVSRSYGEKVIQYLREERENGPDSPLVKSRHSSSFRFQVKKRKFQLINVVGLGDILCLPTKDKSKETHAMLGRHRQVIFKEDMYQVIHSAHVNGERHRGYKGTFKKINATYCNIPREVVSKFVTLCKFCRKTHACFAPSNKKSEGATANKARKKKDMALKKKEIEMAFMTRCQVDIIDMQSSMDTEGNFSYILHFLDHHTKYNVLVPLKRTEPLYVAKKLCRYVFGHFGLPRIINSNFGRKYVNDVIRWILQLWSTDAQILNGNPRFKKLATLIEQRQKTIRMLIETIRDKQQTPTDNWSSWLPGIQYSLNTNQFESDSPPSYYIVYSRRPKVYTYAPNNKDIPREEDVLEGETEENTQQLNEVITVSMNDPIQNATGDTILISQLPLDNLPSHGKHNMQLKTGSSNDLINSTALGGISLALGDQQYTIISANIGVDGQTLQIPVINIGDASMPVTVQGGPTAVSMDQSKTLINNDGTLQLHNNTSMNLDETNTSNLRIENEHLTLSSHHHGTLVGLNRDTLGGLNNRETLGGLNNRDTLGGLANSDNRLSLNSGDDGPLVLSSQDDSELTLGNLETSHGSLELPNLKMEDDCFRMRTKPSSPQFSLISFDSDMDLVDIKNSGYHSC